MTQAWYEGEAYFPVTPCADTQEQADKCERLMFIHSKEDSHLFIAPRGMQTAGWVLGHFPE